MISKASDRLGIDFEKLLFEENENLGKAEFTQPAILLVSSIEYAVFKEKCNITPEFVLGHWKNKSNFFHFKYLLL